MDKQVPLNLNDKQFIKYIKLVCIALLIVMEIVVCAQRAVVLDGTVTDYWLFSTVVVCCVFLAVIESINAFVKMSFAMKMVFYGFDSALLLAISAITGNAFLSALFCIVLTQFYISVEKFKDRTILFGCSCGFFTISFIVGWITVNSGAQILTRIVDILGGVILGLFVIGMHYTIANFLLKFYRTNTELSLALKEADESREKLKEVYEQLSKTAVYEERNRIAKDIHDNAGHAMTTVIMQTEAAKVLIDSDPAEAKNRIISANLQARDALERMRESVHLLAGRTHANTLKEDLEEIIAQSIDGTELKIRCDLEDIGVDEKMHRYICNSVKETLANGVRHGHATAFYIECKKSFGTVTLIISDNGEGAEDIVEGFGLRGVREKAEEFGGTCIFSSESGEGFETQITLPIKGD